jgi:hypothetical protein
LVFHVDITDLALEDAADYIRFIRDVNKESEAAERWFHGVVKEIAFITHPGVRSAPVTLSNCRKPPELGDGGALTGQ